LQILQQMTPIEEYKSLYAQWINEGREPGQTGERLWELMVEMTGTENDEVVDRTFKQIIEEMKEDDRYKNVMAYDEVINGIIGDRLFGRRDN